MPLRKEPKEPPIVYPASKRKAPPFKPLRPSKFVRTTSTESSNASAPPPRRVVSAPAKAKKPVPFVIDDDDEDDDEIDEIGLGGKKGDEDGTDTVEDSDEELDLAPRATLSKSKKPAPKPPPAVQSKGKGKEKAKPTTAIADILSSPTLSDIDLDLDPVSTQQPATRQTEELDQLPLTQPNEIPQPSQPLVLRLLHEAFADKSTTIDKHAIQVLQKYLEVFVREAIARTAQAKEAKVERGEAKWDDRAWLEVEDLEGVVGGLVMDF